MIIGTAGHIDHGKTTLVKALTGIDADRLPEEKARGITLDLGYAYTPLANGTVLGFVDMPGHEKLIHNMLAGATGIDFVLLVIAADDGPMPQTREHLELLDLLGLTQGAVALTKIDAVSPQRLAQAHDEIKQLLASSSLAGSPVFPVSGKTGEGIVPLREHLQQSATTLPERSPQGHFRLAIDRCFTLAGIGTVVTGTAHSGKVGAGETAVISPPGLKARIRSLRVQDRPATQGQSGDRIALALTGDFEKKDIARGMWLVDPAQAVPLTRFHGELRAPAGQAPLTHLQAVHVHLGSDDITGRVALLEGTSVGATIDPTTGTRGATALVEILLDRASLAVRGDRFILRDASARRTVAGGRVLDIFPPLRHKRNPARLALLAAMRDDDPAQTLAQLAASSRCGIDLLRFVIQWNLTEAAAETLWQQSGLRLIRAGDTHTGFPAASWHALGERLLAALERDHLRAPDMIGVERERLRRMTDGNLPRGVFDALVDELLDTSRLAQTRAWLHLPTHRASVSAADSDLFQRLKPLLDAAPNNPPRVRDIARAAGLAEDHVRQLFKRLARAGELYPVAHDHYFTAAAVSQLAQVVAQLHHEHGAARAADFRTSIFSQGQGGRKVAIQILEFFDRIGYTRRVRDEHLLRRADAAHDWMIQ